MDLNGCLSVPTVALAYCQAQTAVAKSVSRNQKKKLPQTKENEEGETDMNTFNEVQEQRRYLQGELREATTEKRVSLETKYGLRDNNPKNAKDAIQMIKDGKITINENLPPYYGWVEAIRFRDPNLKEDQEGFKAAKVFLDKAVTDVERTILIKTPDEGLKAVIDFESKTFN